MVSSGTPPISDSIRHSIVLTSIEHLVSPSGECQQLDLHCHSTITSVYQSARRVRRVVNANKSQRTPLVIYPIRKNGLNLTAAPIKDPMPPSISPVQIIKWIRHSRSSRQVGSSPHRPNCGWDYLRTADEGQQPRNARPVLDLITNNNSIIRTN